MDVDSQSPDRYLVTERLDSAVRRRENCTHATLDVKA
jgi:hypothetical protein